MSAQPNPNEASQNAPVDGGPAFPVDTSSSPYTQYGAYGHQSGPNQWQFGGMTLRDYFAAKALSGELASQCDADGRWMPDQDSMSRLAKYCYLAADAMLKAREARS